MNQFLLLTDYDTQIRNDVLNIITDNTDGIRTQTEKAAIAQVKTILEARHDLICLFPELIPYLASVAYTEGQHVIHNGILYTALLDTIGSAPPLIWDNATGYNLDDEVIYNSITYKALQTIPAGTALADIAFWQVVTPPVWVLSTARNPYLILILVDIVLYHIHSRISPNNIPKIRLDRYDEAMTWLKQASKGEASLTDCLKVDIDNNPQGGLAWGSQTKNDNYY